MLPPKDEIETIPIGSPAITLQNVSDYWTDETRQRTLANIISGVQKKLYENKFAIGAMFTRYFLVSDNFNAILADWIDENEGKSTALRFNDPTRAVDVLGKNYTWGDGSAENTFSIVCITEYVALALMGVEGAREDDSAKHILAHELAHSHEQFLRVSSFGQHTSVFSDNWEGIKVVHAKYAWAEYFAETAAHQCYPDHELFTVDIFMSFFQNIVDVIEQAINDYRTSHDLEYLWNLCIAKSSDVLTSLARTIAVNDEQNRRDLLARVGNIYEDWTEAFEHVIAGLEAVPDGKLLESDFDVLCESVEKVVNAFGIFPRKHPEHTLWLDVP